MFNRNKQNLLNKWFGGRMPIADVVELQQRSTYILPTKAGLFMLGVILLMMVGSTNYQNNLAFLLTFLIISIGLVSIIFTFKNLQGLIFKVGSISNVCVSEVLQIEMLVSSQTKQKHLSIGSGFSIKESYYFDVDEDFGINVFLPIIPEQRGRFYLPKIMATSSFPFGLLRAWTWFKFESPILIYPKPIEPPAESGQGHAEEEQGDHKTSGVDDLYGLKTYQTGDPISRIDWKAFSRERGLYSKEFVAYQSQDLVFSWDDFGSVDNELKLSYLCFLVLEASHSNYEYSLILPDKKIAKNTGQHHMNQCLEALALFGMPESD